MKLLKDHIKSITLLLMISFGHVYAQETCMEKLYNASLLYEKRQLDQVIELAKSCAVNSNSASIQWQAYRLLAMAYIAENRTSEARKAAEMMMELNPSYKSSPIKDPIELTRILKSVKVIPKFSTGLVGTLGTNLTYPQVMGTYNGAYYKKEYLPENSWRMGVNLGYHLNEIISLNTGISSTSLKYKIEYKVENWDMSVKESYTYLVVPFYARFNTLPIKKFKLFADVGTYTRYLVNSSSDFHRSNVETKEEQSTVKLNSRDRHNKWDLGMLCGLGVMYKVGNAYFALDTRYNRSYSNVTNSATRYKQDNLFRDYYFQEDDLRLHNLAFSFSVIYNLKYRIIKGV